MRRTVGGVLVLLPALLLVAALVAEDRPKDTPAPADGKIAVGSPAPDIEGMDVNDKKLKLSDYKGKVVMVDFWGNW